MNFNYKRIHSLKAARGNLRGEYSCSRVYVCKFVWFRWAGERVMKRPRGAALRTSLGGNSFHSCRSRPKASWGETGRGKKNSSWKNEKKPHWASTTCKESSLFSFSWNLLQCSCSSLRYSRLGFVRINSRVQMICCSRVSAVGTLPSLIVRLRDTLHALAITI